uniref:Uncharacterized protein n=1 Tax=Fusarium oxysporum (strain Fo5176) TaxID=660025 RepID=A0A0D2XBX4_FUSOF
MPFANKGVESLFLRPMTRMTNRPTTAPSGNIPLPTETTTLILLFRDLVLRRVINSAKVKRAGSLRLFTLDNFKQENYPQSGEGAGYQRRHSPDGKGGVSIPKPFQYRVVDDTGHQFGKDCAWDDN